MKIWHLTLILIVMGVILGGMGTRWYLSQAKNFPIVTTSGVSKTITLSPTAPATELATWTDPAGFAFKYPKGLALNKHDEDKDNYAHLEFSDPSHPGSLIVWAKDTSAKDVTTWTKSDKRFADANIIDTSLGGKPAKKIFVTNSQNMLVTGAIDEAILFTIETTPGNSPYWSNIHATVSNSFVFMQPATRPDTISSDSDTGSDEAVDEEEVVQ